jgi:HAD superfamily hydrolase (TIGR01509 family)
VSIPKFVIFDCDGVLVDSEGISNTVLASALSTAGVSTTTEEAQSRYRGMLLADVATIVEAETGTELPARFWEQYERDRDRAFATALAAVDGAREAVLAAKALGLAVCVASQGRRSKTELTLGLAGLRDLFDSGAIFSAYEVPRGKPHPDLFRHAAATMRVPVQACVVVEDTPIGVRAAQAADMAAVRLASEPAMNGPGAHGEHLIGSLAELPPLLDRLCRTGTQEAQGT